MSTQDFRPPHEERRPMHSGDAERLADLEFMVKDADKDLEDALIKAELANTWLSRCRRAYTRRVKDRDEFKAAMQGMKDGRYAI